MEEEVKTLDQYYTWRQRMPLPGTRPLTTEIILRLKKDSAGRPAIFKA